jgi:hypothetical protein
MPLLSDEYKNNVGIKLTQRLGLALEQGEVELEDVEDVSSTILGAFESIQSQEEMDTFLQTLSTRWSFFTDVVTEEKGKQSTIDDIVHQFQDRNVTFVGSGKAT